jgi:hypothetical protein
LRRRKIRSADKVMFSHWSTGPLVHWSILFGLSSRKEQLSALLYDWIPLLTEGKQYFAFRQKRINAA